MQPTDTRIELKYLIGADLSAQVRAWAREHLGVDTNCAPDGNDSYYINTLYFDSPELDVFHRTGRVGSTKHRIRRYGREQILWLETKSKKQLVVRKNRTAVPESELLARFVDGVVQEYSADAQGPWCGDWFLDRVVRRNLRPTIQVSYQRFARISIHNGESLRLTIDNRLTASPAEGCKVLAFPGDRADTQTPQVAFGDHEILELKFHNHIPYLFRELLRTFAIPLTGFSKFRTAIEATGAAVERGSHV